MSIHCIHCGTELPDIAQFCLSCGKPPRGEAPPAAASTVNASPPETYPAYLNAPIIRSDGPSAPDPLIPPPPPLASYYSTESLYAPALVGAPSGSAPAQRKSRRGLWIALAVIVVVLAAGGAVYYFASQSTPTKTLQAACDAIKSGDHQALQNLYTTDIRLNEVTGAQWLFLRGYYKGYKGGVASCTVSGVNEQGASASGTISFKFGDGSMETYNVQLVDENGTWKISGIGAGS